MADRLPNLRPLAAAAVREALDGLPTGDVSQVVALIRRRMTGQRHTERTRFETLLAFAAADFASLLSDEQRAEVFARLDASEAELVAGALAGLLAMRTRVARGVSPDA